MRASAFAVTALWIAGCAPGARLTELRIETDVPGVTATRITAFDGECGHAIPEDAVTITGIERLPAGEWTILVEGISDDCRVLARHCERVRLPTDAPLEVTLALVQPEPACGRDLICDGAGECIPCDESCAAPRIETGGDFACVVDPRGLASCWGNDAAGQLPGVEGAQSRAVGVSFLDDARSFSFGHQTGCAVGADGLLRCWGQNDDGQCGQDPAMVPVVDEPTLVDLTEPVDLVECARSFCCARTLSDELHCFGEWAPNPSGLPHHEPRVIDVEPVVQLAGGQNAMCGLHADGAVSCWGFGDWPDEEGRWVRGVRTVARIFERAVAITVGEQHACALRGNGSVWCWGLGTKGRLGVPPETLEPCPIATDEERRCAPNPVQMREAAGITMLAASTEATCVVDGTGRIRCVGDNRYGQLGDGTTEPRDTLGAPVAVLVAPQRLSGGEHYFCASDRGDVYCWGWNAEGRAGLGGAPSSPVPALVLPARRER